MAKRNKKISPEYDSGRETRVLLEEINDQVKVIAEQHGSLQQNMAEMKSDIYVIKRELESVKITVVENRKEIRNNSYQIKELKTGQDELRKDYRELRVGQDELRKDYRELRVGQDELRNNYQGLKADHNELKDKLDIIIDNHEKRIQKLEVGVSA